MAENLTITLTGIQQDESGERNISSSDAPAQYHEKNGTHYIFFEETDAESGARIKSTIKYKDQTMELTKKGNITTRMVFQTGQEFITDYVTPLGCLKMGIFTHSLDCYYKKGLPQLKACYTLTNEGITVSENTIIIKLSKTL